MPVYAIDCTQLEIKYRRFQTGQSSYPTMAQVYQDEQGDLVVATTVFELRETFATQVGTVIETAEMPHKKSLFVLNWQDLRVFRQEHSEFSKREESIFPDELQALAQQRYQQHAMSPADKKTSLAPSNA